MRASKMEGIATVTILSMGVPFGVFLPAQRPALMGHLRVALAEALAHVVLATKTPFTERARHMAVHE